MRAYVFACVAVCVGTHTLNICGGILVKSVRHKILSVKRFPGVYGVDLLIGINILYVRLVIK